MLLSVALQGRLEAGAQCAPYKMAHGFHLSLMIEIGLNAACITTDDSSNKLLSLEKFAPIDT